MPLGVGPRSYLGGCAPPAKKKKKNLFLTDLIHLFLTDLIHLFLTDLIHLFLTTIWMKIHGYSVPDVQFPMFSSCHRCSVPTYCNCRYVFV